jgi:hypothetical protein
MRGFGQRNLPKDSSGEFIVTKGNELSEIEKVKEFLDPGETVQVLKKGFSLSVTDSRAE